MKPAVLLLILFLAFGVSGQTATVIVDKATLRGTPSDDGKIVETLKRGDIVEVLNRQGEWLAVQSKEYIGWLIRDNIQEAGTFCDDCGGNERLPPGRNFSQLLTLDPTPSKDELATVWVYMPSTRSGLHPLSGTFFVDNKRTAEISENTLCVLRVKPGKHSFYVKKRSIGEVELDTEKGGVYYVKITALFEEGRTRFREVTVVPFDEGSSATRDIKPIKKKDIYNNDLVGDMSVLSP